MHQMVVARGEIDLQSPTASATSISSVLQHITDWLGGASTRLDHNRNVDERKKKAPDQYSGNEGS